jgi:hypothetical protein
VTTAPTTAVTIDLGVVDLDEGWGDSAADRPAPGPSRGWGLLLSLAALLSLTAAMPLPAQPEEVARIRLGVGAFRLVGHALYLLQRFRVPTEVDAVDAGDGQSRWQYVPEGNVGFANVEAVGDTVLFSSDTCTTGAAGSTAAVDARTGRELWRRVGVPLQAPPGAPVAVVTRGSWSDRCGAMLGNGRALTGALHWDGVDRATGAVRWAATVPPGTRIALDSGQAGARWVALLDPQGGVSVLDLATGVRSTPVNGLVDRSVLWFVGAADLVLVVRLVPGSLLQLVITGFDRRTLAPRWTARVPAREGAAGATFLARPCGQLICITADDTTALDPETGVARWHALRAAFTDVPGGLLADTSWGRSETPGSAGVFIYDPLTGRPTVGLGNWRLLGVDEARQRLLVGEASANSMIFAWLAGDGLEPLAVLPGWFDTCQIGLDRLVCQTNLDELWVLRLAR